MHGKGAVNALCDGADGNAAMDGDIGRVAFIQQHLDDIPGRMVAEKLAQCFFMIRDAMLFHQRDEILRRVTAQSRFAKMRIARQVFIGRGIQICKITAPAPRDTNLLGDFRGVIDHHDPAAALARLDGAHQARSPRPYDQYIRLHEA